MTPVHIIKLVVGVSDIKEFYDNQRLQQIDYNGTPAVPCWTRYKPKRADEILQSEGSIYRVIKGRIVCRHRILGFEMVDTKVKGTMCMIMQDAEMIETVAMPKRAFQGWRYLKPGDTPPDKGIYHGEEREEDEIPNDIAKGLKEAGLL